MENSKLPITTYTTAAFVIGITLLLLGWMFMPYNILEQDSMIVDPPVVKAGNTLTYHFNYCKNLDIPATLSLQLIDTLVYNYHTVDSNVPKGCGDFDRQIFIPDSIPPGTYFIRSTIKYKVNPLRDIIYVNDSNTIEITK